ncbi:MAG: hypothetical protein AABW89_04140 [Nanoarchaeota archaeon]
MEDENIVQQVDSYVRELLSVARERDKRINPESPTRGQRLLAAMHFDSKREYWLAMEIMVGKRVGARDQEGRLLEMMMLARAFEVNPDRIRRFYEGFAHTYFSSDKSSKVE